MGVAKERIEKNAPVAQFAPGRFFFLCCVLLERSDTSQGKGETRSGCRIGNNRLCRSTNDLHNRGRGGNRVRGVPQHRRDGKSNKEVGVSITPNFGDRGQSGLKYCGYWCFLVPRLRGQLRGQNNYYLTSGTCKCFVCLVEKDKKEVDYFYFGDNLCF